MRRHGGRCWRAEAEIGDRRGLPIHAAEAVSCRWARGILPMGARYPADGHTVDQSDAYAIARWLKEVGQGPLLDDIYFDVVMTGTDCKMAELEGWVLGVM